MPAFPCTMSDLTQVRHKEVRKVDESHPTPPYCGMSCTVTRVHHISLVNRFPFPPLAQGWE